MKTRILYGALDVLTGLLAFVVFFAVDPFFHVASDLRSAVIWLAVLYLFAGFVRGRNGNPWMKGFLISAGGAAIMLPLLWAALFHAILAIWLSSAVLFAFCGVWARQFFAHQARTRAGLVLVAPLAVVVIFAMTVIPRVAAGISGRQTAGPLPEFTVTGLDGTTVRSSDWHGRVVLVDYWATWCPACRRELPELQKLYARYQHDPGVVFWAIDVQQNGETPEKASAFFQKFNYTLPMAIDTGNSAGRLSKQFAFEGFPALILVDRSGQVRLVHIGYDGSERLRENLSKEIDTLLKQPS